MLRFFVTAGLLACLAACAPKQPAAPAAAAVAAPSTQAAVPQATILAVREVPGIDPQPIRVLLGRLGAAKSGIGTELILRADDGAVMSVVQAGASEFRAGQRVALVRGPKLTLVSALTAGGAQTAVR